MIITDHPDEVNAALLEAFSCGTTRIQAVGGFSNAEKGIIYFVVNRFQIARVRSLVRQLDPMAFVTITEVADVLKASPVPQASADNA